MQTLIHDLNQEEILRYLGYNGQAYSSSLEQTIEHCIQTTLHTITPKYIYRRFPITFDKNAIRVGHTPILLVGNSIQKHLLNCEEIYILCVTLGLEIDRTIRTAMITSPDKGVILNSCATAAAEQLADITEQEITELCRQEGKHTTWRFSAGYGDLPLESQKDIITVMDTHRKIGVSLTDSLLMTPSKSVTAIIGVTDTTTDLRKNKCDYCSNRNDCLFRKRGTLC